MKIKLPRQVGEELDYCRKLNGASFENYYSSFRAETYFEAHRWVMSEPLESNRNARIVNLLNAWVSGWEAE